MKPQSFPDIDVLVSDIETFIRTEIIPYENDTRLGSHGPDDALIQEMRGKARKAGLLTPHISKEGHHMPWRDAARVLRACGLSPLGPPALNVAAPDEGNMNLLSKVATPAQQRKYLDPLISGAERSAFFMTEPASDGGAGSDPSMLKTTAVMDENHWVINGRKAYITGVDGANVGIIMAKTEKSATMFLTRLPHPNIKIERILDTIDNSMPGGHAIVNIDNLRVSSDDILGELDEGFKYAQVRLAPARLTHCMRWLGCCDRAQEIATQYACERQAFKKLLIDHEGVGFMLAENQINLKQCELIINWCAETLDSGELGTTESSMAKVAVSEALFQISDNCIQVMGGSGVTGDSVVEQIFREIRAFRIYDGPTEVHKWSLAKKIKRSYLTQKEQ